MHLCMRSNLPDSTSPKLWTNRSTSRGVCPSRKLREGATTLSDLVRCAPSASERDLQTASPSSSFARRTAKEPSSAWWDFRLLWPSPSSNECLAWYQPFATLNTCDMASFIGTRFCAALQCCLKTSNCERFHAYGSVSYTHLRAH